MTRDVAALEREIEALAAAGFAGVVRVDVAGTPVLRAAYGLADRARAIPMTVGTRLAIASGAKTLTALAVLSLVDDGVLGLATTARSLLGDDLPLVADDVTVEHLLAHRSGIGDYLDEDTGFDVGDYLMPRPVHELVDTEDYLPILDGHATKFPAGTGFSYCNGGYVLLALLAERASGVGFHELVRQRVTARAGMDDTAYLRSDDLPGDAALGYVDVHGAWRSTVFHLPVRGSGDGGVFTTVDDVHRLWGALLARRIVSDTAVEAMLRPRSDPDEDGLSYGFGLWLDVRTGEAALHGSDAGSSFYGVHDATRRLTWTVVANTIDGARPVHRAIEAWLR
ncbi:beta-lactamase family protein [Nocardioides sp. KIGAM211]|uniref:Beta-lactamase family protein n=1 Tax=Nocardioides luti TaxID=2761101 RepID=A0A7X0VA65_9ACTN|nr:serine hydrolase domain-containing protein [Nocardioides luti]MBB6627015.1 beta-lactamase family protein [Nocardioides luti]